MSLRLSTAVPRACSGLMYAAVSSSMPAWVMRAGDAIVGEAESEVDVGTAPSAAMSFAKPKSRTLTTPSGVILMDDPLVMRRFERLGDLSGDRQRLVDRDRAARDPLQ